MRRPGRGTTTEDMLEMPFLESTVEVRYTAAQPVRQSHDLVMPHNLPNETRAIHRVRRTREVPWGPPSGKPLWPNPRLLGTSPEGWAGVGEEGGSWAWQQAGGGYSSSSSSSTSKTHGRRIHEKPLAATPGGAVFPRGDTHGSRPGGHVRISGSSHQGSAFGGEAVVERRPNSAALGSRAQPLTSRPVSCRSACAAPPWRPCHSARRSALSRAGDGGRGAGDLIHRIE